jgi:exopolysaccharide/PEP-CTERM locus tyrosine autokinase
MTHATKRDEESLIERAAKVYDFGAHLRRREAVPVEPEAIPTAFVPSAAQAQVPAGKSRDVARDDRDLAPWDARAVQEHRPLDLTLDLIHAAPAPPLGAEKLSPEAAATLAAIPPELRAGAEPQTTGEILPAGVAHIDRTMLAEKGMLVPGAPIGALAEEFRLVKRQLLLNARVIAAGPLGERARTILVGSGKPGDGKTFCAINLAISLAAERDVEVVLVDGDFAKPDVMASLGLDDSVGFLDILADPTIDLESCIVQTDVPQLSLLPAGKRTHSDTELLASARTGDVIDRLLAANPKRILVFDTPPTLAASPASVLALLVGQVMLVVRADRTTEADVREAVNLLDGCERISLVLNSVSYEPGGGRFGSYYGQEK